MEDAGLPPLHGRGANAGPSGDALRSVRPRVDFGNLALVFAELRSGVAARQSQALVHLLNAEPPEHVQFAHEFRREGGVDVLLELVRSGAGAFGRPAGAAGVPTARRTTSEGALSGGRLAGLAQLQLHSGAGDLSTAEPSPHHLKAIALRVLRNLAKVDEAIAVPCIDPCLEILRQQSEVELHHHAAYVLRNCMHHHRFLAQRIREQGGIGLLLSLLKRSFNSHYHRDTAAWGIFKCVCKENSAAADVRALGGLQLMLAASETLACARALTKCAENDTGSWPCLLQNGLAKRLWNLISCARQTSGQTNWVAVFLGQLHMQAAWSPAVATLAADSGIIPVLCRTVREPPMEDNEGREVADAARRCVVLLAGKIDSLWPIFREGVIADVLELEDAARGLREQAASKAGMALLGSAAGLHRWNVAHGVAHLCGHLPQLQHLMRSIKGVELLVDTVCDHICMDDPGPELQPAAGALETLAVSLAGCPLLRSDSADGLAAMDEDGEGHGASGDTAPGPHGFQSFGGISVGNGMPPVSAAHEGSGQQQSAVGATIDEAGTPDSMQSAPHRPQLRLPREWVNDPQHSTVSFLIGTRTLCCFGAALEEVSVLFKDMLSERDPEGLASPIPITRIAHLSDERAHQVFELAVQYTYTGELDSSMGFEDSLDLAICANCFHMEALQLECEGILAAALEETPLRLEEAFEAAQTHHLEHLETACVWHMARNLTGLVQKGQLQRLNAAATGTPLAELLVTTILGHFVHQA